LSISRSLFTVGAPYAALHLLGSLTGWRVTPEALLIGVRIWLAAVGIAVGACVWMWVWVGVRN
jgi:hypothetical protein